MAARFIPSDLMVAAHINALLPISLSQPRSRKVLLLYGSELWSPISRSIARILATRVDRVMAISRFTASEAIKVGVPLDRLTVTHLGAALQAGSSSDGQVVERFGLASEQGRYPYFLTVSRLDEPHKGHDVFLQALPAILAVHPDVRYVIAGEGSRAHQLWDLARSLGIEEAVRMIGPIDEASKGSLMRECVAYVMLSRESRRPALFEGLGIAYLEAALAGRPSLAGASGGVQDAVVHKGTGLLVDPVSVQAVVDAALSLLASPEYANALGQAGRLRAESEFTWDQAVDRMERVLREAIA
jgi:phosphatidylinositol alpha-1,6-mannosyltransferase